MDTREGEHDWKNMYNMVNIGEEKIGTMPKPDGGRKNEKK